MRTIARFMDARNTAEGKFLSVLLSVLLVFSFLNVTMFTDYAGADPNEASEENSLTVEEPEFTEPATTAEEPEAEKASEEVTTPTPVEEKQETAVEEEPAATDVEVELQLVDATIVYDGTDYGDGDKLVAPLCEDLKFSVKAAEGAEVMVAATIGDEDVVLSPEADGNYILKGDRVTDALAVIGVVAEIPETDQAEEPADVPTVTPESPMQKAPANGSAIYAAADYTVKAGGKVQIYGGPEYFDGTSHKWSSSNISVCTVNGNGKTATATGKSQGTVTITHTYKKRKNGQTYTETFTVEVTAPTPVESISVNGASTVAEFNTTKLIAALSPAGSEAEIAWSSDDSSVATVDRNGTVTGVSAGTTTIRATITKADGSTVSAAHVITVTRSNSRTPAIFYYLKTPTSDPNSNDTGQWGPSLGYGKIDVAGAVWVNNKNCYVSSQPNRVVEWPENVPGGVVPEGTDTWNDIFNEYKETVEGGNVTEEDIESITLVPYKISNNDDGYHVDCQVVVKAKGLATARFYLWDAGATAYEYKGGETVREGKTVSVPGSVSSLPETKTADGRTYRLVAWRTDRSLTGSDVAFPYAVTENVDFYAKYVADYIVTYELDGGSWSANPKTLYAAGDMVTVANEQPQKAGYEFAGWKKSTDESTVRPGDIFSMPEADVTLAAQWTPIKYTVEYDLANGTLQDSTEKTSYSDLLYGDNTPTIKNPVRWGYTFRDWDPVVSETVTGNATYVAQWEPVQYTFTIVAKSDSLTYDGKYHGAAGLQGVEPIPGRNGEQGVMVQVGEETFYITGYSAVVSDERAENGQVKDAGEYTLSPQAGGNVVIYDSEGKVFDNGKNPTINLVDGKLTINKRSVTLTSATDSKPYDGTALTNHNVTVGGDGFIEGHGATYSFTGSQTLVGNSANAFTYTLTGEGCTEGEGGNYAITTTEGDLAVSNRDAAYEVTVTANSTTATYDGTKKSASGFVGETEQGVPVTANGQTFYVTGLTSSAEGSNVSDSVAAIPVTGTAVVKDAAGNDVTNQFNVKATAGSLTINKRSVTLTSATDSKPYDGTALTNHNVTVGGDGFIEGHGATYSFTGSQTLVGNSANAFTYTLTGEGCTEGEGGNYAITTTEGDLAVSKKSIDETPNPDDGTVTPVLDVNYVNSVVYDGQDQTPTMTVIDRDNKNTLTSADYTVEFQRDGVKTDDLTTAGPITIVITGQGNYEGTITRSFEITRRPVTITADDSSKAFGTSDPERFGASVTNAVIDGFEFQYSVAREAGENIGEYAIVPSGAAEQGKNYTVTYVSGIFTITPAGSNVVENVNIAGADGLTKIYDGAPATVTATAAVEGSTFEYSLDGQTWTTTAPSFTNAGTYPVWVRANAANYSTTPAVRVAVTISQRPAVIVVGSSAKVAGTADPIFTGTVTGLVNANDLGAVTYYRANTEQGAAFYTGVLNARYVANPNLSLIHI